MRKRGAKAPKSPKETQCLHSPLPTDSPVSPPAVEPFDFDLGSLAGSSCKKAKGFSSRSPTPVLFRPLSTSPPQVTTPSTISGLRDFASSRSEAIKRSLDLCHAEIAKDFEASRSRVSKRFKMQMQACIQVSDEADKEYKKISDRIKENTALVKDSYAELINEAQASASRVCKVAIPELINSLEKSIEAVRSRHGISSTPIKL